MPFTEDMFEQAVLELLEKMGYTHIYAPDMNRTDYSSPILENELRDSLVRLNKKLPLEAIDEAVVKLKTFDTGSLVQKNLIFMDYLQNGITVKYVGLDDCGDIFHKTHLQKVCVMLPWKWGNCKSFF